MLKKILALTGGFLIITTNGSTVLSCHKNETNLENKIQNKQLGRASCNVVMLWTV